MKKFMIAAAAMLMAGSANAAVLYSGMPTGNLYQGYWINNSANQNFLVRFDLATNVEVTGFSILAGEGFANVGTLARFKLRADGGSDTPVASNLESFATTISSVEDYEPGIDKLTVSFAPIALSAGSYWAGLSGENLTMVWASYANTNVGQPSGQWQLNADGLQIRPGIYNLAFEVTGNTVAGGVPEPAAWAMMLAGFGLVGGAMRRRGTLAAA